MRIDLYTRVILTTIALCLVWLCVVLTPGGTVVSAQSTVQDVRIVGIRRPTTTRVRELGQPTREVLMGDWDQLPTTN